MSELSKLVGKGKKIKLGEIEIEIKPLTVSSMPLLMQMGQEGNPKEQAEAMQAVISRTLKDSLPDATDEEIDKIPLEHITTLMEAITDINQLGDDTKKDFITKIKDGRSITTGNKKK